MRKTIMMLLLASTLATPVMAQDDQGRRQWHQRGEGRGNAEVRKDRAEVQQDRQEVRRDRQEVRQDRVEVRRDVRQGNPDEARRDWNALRRDRMEVRNDRNEVRGDRRETWRDRRAVASGVANTPAEQRRDWRQDNRHDWRDNRQDRRDDRRDWRDNRNDNRWSDNRDWGRRQGDWNRGWRNDRRYDWQGWRHQNRDRYRAGRYHAPRGYSYNRWSLGYRLDPWFYGSSYWISDPWSYRLPEAYGPYRWVRYYDDVILVDMRSGQIVDIIYDFFW